MVRIFAHRSLHGTGSFLALGVLRGSRRRLTGLAMYPGLCETRCRRWTDRRIEVRRSPLRVLVVDDYREAAEGLTAYLSLSGFHCNAAFSGTEAIAHVRRCCPDLILMDIAMPQCTGPQAARALRKLPATSGLVIVAHTALDEMEVRRQARQSEFDGYFQKGQPVDRLANWITGFASGL